MRQDLCVVQRDGFTDITLLNYCVLSSEESFAGRLVEVRFVSSEKQWKLMFKISKRGQELLKNTKSIAQTQETLLKRGRL